MTDEGDALRQMLANLGGSDAQDADLVLMQLERDAAHLLELCAIPHAFNEILLAVLAPEASQDLRTGFLAELQLLPAIIDNDGDFALHDIVREQMFRRWLAPERWEEFAAASDRLARYFGALSPLDSADAEANRAISVFHQIEADTDTGFAAFLALYLRSVSGSGPVQRVRKPCPAHRRVSLGAVSATECLVDLL
jgi:hypothetical protein